MADSVQRLVEHAPEGYWIFITSESLDFSSNANSGLIYFSNPRRLKDAADYLTFVDLKIVSKDGEQILLDRMEVGKIQDMCNKMIEKAEIHELK